MEFQDAVAEFGRLTRDQQIRLLVLFGHNLTIGARDTYEVQGPRVLAPERLRRINDIQHVVFGHLGACVTPDNRWRYPDEN